MIKWGLIFLMKNVKNSDWEFWKSIEVNLDEQIRIGAPSTNGILDTINRDGYLIGEGLIRLNERAE